MVSMYVSCLDPFENRKNEKVCRGLAEDVFSPTRKYYKSAALPIKVKFRVDSWVERIRNR